MVVKLQYVSGIILVYFWYFFGIFLVYFCCFLNAFHSQFARYLQPNALPHSLTVNSFAWAVQPNEQSVMPAPTHRQTHTHPPICLFKYINMCVCVCVQALSTLKRSTLDMEHAGRILINLAQPQACRTHTPTHTHTTNYICMCVVVCVCLCACNALRLQLSPADTPQKRNPFTNLCKYLLCTVGARAWWAGCMVGCTVGATAVA